MGFFDRFMRRNPSTKSSAITPSFKVSYNQAVFTNWSYLNLVETGYLRNVIVYRCIELGSQLFSQTPWYAQNTQEKEIPETHPLLKLMKRPNPFQSGVQFRHQLRAQLRLHGNCYVEKVRGIDASIRSFNAPRELYAIPPERMRIDLDSGGRRIAYVYEFGGFKKRWPIDPDTGVSDVLHIRRFHPTNDLYGLGDLYPASRSTDTWNSVVSYNKTLLDNSGNPPGMFSMKAEKDQVVTPQQYEAFMKTVDSYYGGPQNAGKPIVAPNVDYKPLSWSPREMEYNTAKESVAKDICISFGVPYVLLNMTDATFSNAEEARLSYFEDQILPELELFKDEFNNWFQDDFPNVELDYDAEALPFMAKKLEARYNAVTQMQTILTINECRELFGFEKIDGFDYIFSRVASPDLANPSDPSMSAQLTNTVANIDNTVANTDNTVANTEVTRNPPKPPPSNKP